MDSILAITPLDGRYSKATESLKNYVSEYALFKYRVMVEIEYFIAICQLPIEKLQNISEHKLNKLREITLNFTPAECLKIKDIEKTINHDVKAVEYYLHEKFNEYGFSDYKSFIHFGLTSQDINSSAVIVAFSSSGCI